MSKGFASVLVFALVWAPSLPPCSIVTIGGPKPIAVKEVTGTVVGSGHYKLMGTSHNEERRAIVVPGATILLKARVDLEILTEEKLPADQKFLAGGLAKWKCEAQITQATTDAQGKFRLDTVPPGKYCVEIIGPPAVLEVAAQMRFSFVIDVTETAPDITLVADMTPLWPDCSGGPQLLVKEPQREKTVP